MSDKIYPFPSDLYSGLGIIDPDLGWPEPPWYLDNSGGVKPPIIRPPVGPPIIRPPVGPPVIGPPVPPNFWYR